MPLLDLPVTIANQILEKLDPMAMLTCRKVCRALRSTIDKLGILFDDVRFGIWENSVTMTLNGVDVNFTDAMNGDSTVTYNKENRIIKEESYLKRAFKDLQILLKHGRGLAVCNYSEDDIATFLIWEGIQVQKIVFEYFSFNDIVSLLPYFDCQVLEDIQAEDSGIIEQFEQITRLDQWKNSKKFILLDSVIDSNQIEQLFHFEEFLVNLDDFSVEHAVQMKDNLLRRSTFKKCTVRFPSNNPSRVAKVFYPDYTDDEEFKFEYSNDENTLSIHFKELSFKNYELFIRRC